MSATQEEVEAARSAYADANPGSNLYTPDELRPDALDPVVPLPFEQLFTSESFSIHPSGPHTRVSGGLDLGDVVGGSLDEVGIILPPRPLATSVTVTAMFEADASDGGSDFQPRLEIADFGGDSLQNTFTFTQAEAADVLLAELIYNSGTSSQGQAKFDEALTIHFFEFQVGGTWAVRFLSAHVEYDL